MWIQYAYLYEIVQANEAQRQNINYVKCRVVSVCVTKFEVVSYVIYFFPKYARIVTYSIFSYANKK